MAAVVPMARLAAMARLRLVAALAAVLVAVSALRLQILVVERAGERLATTRQSPGAQLATPALRHHKTRQAPAPVHLVAGQTLLGLAAQAVLAPLVAVAAVAVALA